VIPCIGGLRSRRELHPRPLNQHALPEAIPGSHRPPNSGRILAKSWRSDQANTAADRRRRCVETNTVSPPPAGAGEWRST